MLSTAAAQSPMDREPKFDPARFPPSVTGPRVMQNLRLFRDPIGYLSAQKQTLGPVFTLRIAPFRAGLVCATNAAANREVLTDQARFIGGGAAWLLEPVVGSRSLILTPPPAHLRNRKLLLPPFHGERVARWSERVRELVVERLPELTTGDQVTVRPWAQRLTLDVILRVVFGLSAPARVEPFSAAVARLMSPALQPLLFTPPWVRADYGRFSPNRIVRSRRSHLNDLILEEVRARRARPDIEQLDDVLSVLVTAQDEHGRGFDDAELCDELTGLVLAGHETTATALAWTFHLLAHNPRARETLLQDLKGGQETYLRAVIKESMRLRPPVFDAVRTAACDTELGGHPVPKHAFVSAAFCVTHLDPDLWHDPTSFIPERHLDGDGGPPAPVAYSFTPFGGGVRRCIGAALAQLELEVVLSEVLRRAVPEPAGAPEVVRLQGVTLIPARGGRVRLRINRGSRVDRPLPTRKTPLVH
jgi:cytochrome P450